MKTCYVSIPFGRKPDVDGRVIDFDRIYHELLKPAVEAAGLQCVRGDELGGVLIQKSILRAVIASDAMVADVSTGNPNVLYELGIRHALARSTTIVVSCSRVPFNVSHTMALRYTVGDDGASSPGEAESLRSRLTELLLSRVQRPVNDSPLYEFFPGLRAELPDELRPPPQRASRTGGLGGSVDVQAPQGPDSKAAIARAERAWRGSAASDLQSSIELLQRWLSVGQPGEVIRMARELPPDVVKAPQVALILAQAHLQLSQYEEGIVLLNELLARGGDDAESLALLGTFHKRRHVRTGALEDLMRAVDCFRRAHRVAPQDLFVGVNLAVLLRRVGAEAELVQLLPDLRRVLHGVLEESKADYWLFDAALTLAALAGDFEEAAKLAESLLALRPQAWMVASTSGQLQVIAAAVSDEARQQQLQGLLSRLEASTSAREAEEDEEPDDAQL